MNAEAGSGKVIALLLALIVLAAMAEVVMGRAVAPPLEPPRVSSAEVLLRLGDEARARGDVPAARRAYLAALFRERDERSLAGVVAVAEGFAALGDGAAVRQALDMAAPLAAAEGADPAARDRLAALRESAEATAALPISVKGRL